MNADEMKGYELGLEAGRKAVADEMDKLEAERVESKQIEKANHIAMMESQVVDLMNRKDFVHAQVLKERIRELRK